MLQNSLIVQTPFMVIPPEMAVSYGIQMSYGHFLWVFLAPWKFQMGVPPWGGHKGGLIWWGQQGGPTVPEFHPLPLQVHADDRFLRTEQGLLLRALQSGDSGLYSCTATENNFKHIITRVQLHVLGQEDIRTALFPPPAASIPPPAASIPPPPGTGPPKPRYQELAQLLAQPEVGLIHQYCQGYWRHVPPSPREAPGAPRPPKPQDQKKPRNRRHHPPDT